MGEKVERMREYWFLHGPTQHKTIMESKPFDQKSEETEVLDKVIEKFSHGQDDEDDRIFLEEMVGNGISQPAPGMLSMFMSIGLLRGITIICD